MKEILVEKSEEERPLMRSHGRWEDIIKLDLNPLSSD
jgi:hypothetical protein